MTATNQSGNRNTTIVYANNFVGPGDMVAIILILSKQLQEIYKKKHIANVILLTKVTMVSKRVDFIADKSPLSKVHPN